MYRFAATLLTLSALAILPSEAFASSVYKWTDENGVTHYGEAPPNQADQPDQKVDKVKITGIGPSSSDEAKQRREESRKQFNPNQEEEEAAAAQKAEQEANDALRKEYCEKARSNLSALQSGERLRIKDDNGEESAVTDEVRSKEIQRTQEYITKNCSGS